MAVQLALPAGLNSDSTGRVEKSASTSALHTPPLRARALRVFCPVIASAVGGDGLALRDKLEGWVMELGSGKLPAQVAPGIDLDEVARGPAIYLRLPLAEAASPERIRKAAARSLRDGFTSCLFVGQTSAPAAGAACVQTSQCGPGEVCSDWKVCAPPAHPYTASLLYEGVRVLLAAVSPAV